MLKLTLGAVAVVTAGNLLPTIPAMPRPDAPPTIAADIHALMAEAETAPPITCMLAARSVDNGGWLRAGRAPIHPLDVANDPASWERQGSLSGDEVAYLLDRLVTGNGCTREIAVRLLARDESGAARAGLTADLRSPNAGLRAVAAFGLGLIGEDASVDPLLAVIGDADPAPRVNAVWALGRIGNGRAFRPVLRTLDDGDARVRTAAAETLGQLDSTAAVAMLIRHLRSDDAASVRRTSAWALGQLDAAEAIGALGEVLGRDRDAEVREMCAWAIGSIDKPGADAVLLAVVRRDDNPRVRETAAWALGSRDDQANAGALGEALGAEQETRVRATMAWALGSMRPDRAPTSLIAAVNDDNDRVRETAAWAISEIRDSSALPALRRAMSRTDNGSGTQRALLRALVRSGESDAQLLTLFDAKDARVREYVARSLAGGTHIDVWPWPMPRPRPFP